MFESSPPFLDRKNKGKNSGEKKIKGIEKNRTCINGFMMKPLLRGTFYFLNSFVFPSIFFNVKLMFANEVRNKRET